MLLIDGSVRERVLKNLSPNACCSTLHFHSHPMEEVSPLPFKEATSVNSLLYELCSGGGAKHPAGKALHL